MYDYRNNIKIILNKTDADDKSLARAESEAVLVPALCIGGSLLSQHPVLSLYK